MAETAKDLIYLQKTYTNYSGLELPEVDMRSQTFLKPLFRIGTSSSPVTIGTTAIGLQDFYATCALTTGTINPVNIALAQTGTALGGGTVYGLNVVVTAESGRVGGTCNVIRAKLDLGDTGSIHGVAMALSGEIEFPNSSLIRGAAYAIEARLNAQVTSSWGSAGPAGFIRFRATGAGVAEIDTRGYLFILYGCTGAAGKLMGANQNTLRVGIGAEGSQVNQYLFLSEYEDTISIGLTGAKKTLVTGVPEIAIWSTNALTSGTQDVMKIDITQTAAWQTGYLKGIRCTITSEYKLPGSANAVKGIIDFGTLGYVWGDCAPLSSELTMANSVVTHGTYAALELQIGIGASSNWNSAGPLAFIRCKANGTTATMDTYGYLFDLQGLTEGSNVLVDSDGSPTATGGIKCRLGAAEIWLLYRDTAPA